MSAGRCPAGLAFKTRPQQVREMIESALAAGVPFAWFTADEEFGQNPGLCDYLESSRIPYVMAVPKTTQFTDATKKTVQFDALAKRLPPIRGNADPAVSDRRDSASMTGHSSTPTTPTTST